ADGGKDIRVRLRSTIACPEFTARLRCEREVRSVTAGSEELRRLPDGGETLEPKTWRRVPEGIAWCVDLPGGEVEVRLTGRQGDKVKGRQGDGRMTRAEDAATNCPCPGGANRSLPRHNATDFARLAIVRSGDLGVPACVAGGLRRGGSGRDERWQSRTG